MELGGYVASGSDEDRGIGGNGKELKERRAETKEGENMEE